MLHHVIEWATAVSEAVRVLRPGGQLVGYDLLGRAPIHSHGDRNTRMIHTGELETLLDRLPVTDARTIRSRGGLALRFRATKQAPRQ